MKSVISSEGRLSLVAIDVCVELRTFGWLLGLEFNLLWTACDQ